MQSIPAPEPGAFRSDDVRHCLQRSQLASLSRPRSLYLIGAVFLEWGLIVAAAVLASRTDAAWATVMAVLFIATRQHGLLVLMHEFSHRQFSRSKPVWNDAIGDVLTALPFFITVHGFRRDHAQHHAHTSTPADPNWVSCLKNPSFVFPTSPWGMVSRLLLHACGLRTINDLRAYLFTSQMAVGLPRSVQVRQAMFFATAMGLTWYFEAWSAVAIFWLLPLFTGLIGLLYLRDIAEHFAIPDGAGVTRTVIANRLERWFLAPHGVNYHAEHHLCPAIPASRLAQLHELIKERPGGLEGTAITHGYLSGLMREATVRKS